MITVNANNATHRAIIGGMNIFSEMTTGRRIAVVREQRGIKQRDFAVTLGVNVVYVSQVENDHRQPGRALMKLIARTLGTTVGFLERETDDPYPSHAADVEPVYFSPEADAAAQLIDSAPPEERARMLAVVRALAGASAMTHQTPAMPQHNSFAQRLINGERVSQDAGKVRA